MENNGANSLLQIQIFERHKAFGERRKVIENLSQAGHPSVSVIDDKIEKLKETVLENIRVRIGAI